MYAFLTQNRNYIIERKNDVQMRFDNTKSETLDSEIKNKMDRLKQFNPDAIFSQSDDSSFEQENQDKKKINILFPSDSDQTRKNSYTTFQKTPFEKANSVSKKIYSYKVIIKWLDIISSLILIIGTLVAIFENQEFYEINKEKRKTAIKIINFITNKDFSTYNATHVDEIMNVTDYLSNIDKNNFESVKVDFVINETSKFLRAIILFSTTFSLIISISSRWFEYKRTFIYIDKNEISFYKTNLFLIMIFEVMLILPAPYPGLTGYLLYKEFGNPIIIPHSSILFVFSLLRVYFLLKLFKHLTRWTDSTSEYICEKYVCKANTSFAFKAFQKEYPFIMLTIIFIISCYFFGLAVRTFELYYWENFDDETFMHQNWEYQWNAMWFVFVSMTTVGYGDFTPKTQFGRSITIMACLVGVYFVSMMMVFMTEKTHKTDKEEKAFKLITRLKYRKSNKELYSNLIFNFIQICVLKLKKRNNLLDEKLFDLNYKYKHRININLISEIKDNIKEVKRCDFIPTKEQLLDISEQLDSDIKSIKNELLCLTAINESLKNFTDDQLGMVVYLKKNLLAMKLFYELVEKTNKFPELKNLAIKMNIKENPDNSLQKLNTPVKSLFNKKNALTLQKIKKDFNFNTHSDMLAESEHHEEKVKLHFDFMFTKNKSTNTNRKLTKSKVMHSHLFRKQIIRNSAKRKISKKKFTLKQNPIISEFVLNNMNNKNKNQIGSSSGSNSNSNISLNSDSSK